MTRVVALAACHNRRDRTIRCLESFFAQAVDGVALNAVLVDDGSTDGTSDAVRSRFPEVEIISSDGSLYWASSMALAEKRAVAHEPDFLLWLNDDVVLYPNALATLLAAAAVPGAARIVAGYTLYPASSVPSYGGANRVDWHPMRFRPVTPVDGENTSSDTFNGNVVLVPKEVYEAVGGIDGGFEHAFADFDYGLRARALGFEVIVAGVAVGECLRTLDAAAWRDTSLPLVTRYRMMLGRKGVPIASSARYLRRHGGRLWPVYIAATYAKVAVDHAAARVVGRHHSVAVDATVAAPPAGGADEESRARESLMHSRSALEQSNDL